jgi:hypothetical protein
MIYIFHQPLDKKDSIFVEDDSVQETVKILVMGQKPRPGIYKGQFYTVYMQQ